MRIITKMGVAVISLAVMLGVIVPADVSAASAREIREAQTILTKFKIPTGPIDGIWGAQTAQGVCTFRQIAGLTSSRGALTSADMSKLRSYNSSFASLNDISVGSRNGHRSFLHANKTCQTMTYVKANRINKVFKISTGKLGYDTKNGNYLLGSTRPGWSCSTLYPESCLNHNQGINAQTTRRGVLYSTYGNMYNKRVIYGAVLLHGSTSVPTYPASHGCVRTTVADSDWLYRNVSNAGGVVYMSIVGRY